jgi:anti-sigma B factor antagonist
MNASEDTPSALMIFKVEEPRLDASKAPALREALIDLIAKGNKWIVLDLEKVEFMDSAALSSLIAAVKKLGPIGTISVACMRFPVARLFSVTKMDRVFPVNTTVDEAIRSLAA